MAVSGFWVLGCGASLAARGRFMGKVVRAGQHQRLKVKRAGWGSMGRDRPEETVRKGGGVIPDGGCLYFRWGDWIHCWRGGRSLFVAGISCRPRLRAGLGEVEITGAGDELRLGVGIGWGWGQLLVSGSCLGQG